MLFAVLAIPSVGRGVTCSLLNFLSVQLALLLQEDYKHSLSDTTDDVNVEPVPDEGKEDSDQDVFGKDRTVDPDIENMEKKMATRVWEVNKRKKKGGKPVKKGGKQPVKKKKNEKKVCWGGAMCVCGGVMPYVVEIQCLVPSFLSLCGGSC